MIWFFQYKTRKDIVPPGNYFKVGGAGSPYAEYDCYPDYTDIEWNSGASSPSGLLDTYGKFGSSTIDLVIPTTGVLVYSLGLRLRNTGASTVTVYYRILGEGSGSTLASGSTSIGGAAYQNVTLSGSIDSGSGTPKFKVQIQANIGQNIRVYVDDNTYWQGWWA